MDTVIHAVQSRIKVNTNKRLDLCIRVEQSYFGGGRGWLTLEQTEQLIAALQEAVAEQRLYREQLGIRAERPSN